MLILLSASKKRFGSFVTPALTDGNVKVFSVEPRAFKYGPMTYSVYTSFRKDGGMFVWPNVNVSAIFVASTESTAFTFSRVVAPSSKVSFKNASALYFSQNFNKSFTVQPKDTGLILANKAFEPAFMVQPKDTGLIVANKAFDPAFMVSFIPTIVVQRATMSSGEVFTITNGQLDDGSRLYSPYTTSTYQQTLSIQPESF
jgi:hypothetical protein